MSRIHTLNALGNLLIAAIRQQYSWTDDLSEANEPKCADCPF